MLDVNFILRKIKLIQEDLGKLDELSRYVFDELKEDYVKFSAVERLLEKIITRAIDINQHILAEKGSGKEAVRRYEETFLQLADLGVYSTEFAETIAPSAGLRNRLVHEYDNIDQKIIYSSVGEALEQYTKYCSYILQFAENQ